MAAGQSEMTAAMESAVTGSNTAAAEHFSQLMAGPDGTSVSHVITDSYDLLYGQWPEDYDEVVLVLGRDGTLPAETLCQLGLITEDQYRTAQEEIQDDGAAQAIHMDYAAAADHPYYLVAACDHYLENDDGTFTYLEDGAINQDQLLENALEVTVTAVVRPKADADNANLTTALAYTPALTDYLIQHTDQSPVVRAQAADPDTNVLTGIAFTVPDDAGKAQAAKDYLSGLGISEKASFYQMLVYYASSEGSSSSAAMGAMAMDEASQAAALDQYLAGNPDQELLLQVYDQYVAGSTYEDNMTNFGKVSYDAPSSISIYADSFEDKDSIAACIEAYNADKDEDQQITYTDYVAMLTSSITTIINGISYVLIAFVSISLVVSCIMIGIITHISVLERTKEIGILRALGASKRNISQVFNAETFIIGCCAGLLGIVVSLTRPGAHHQPHPGTCRGLQTCRPSSPWGTPCSSSPSALPSPWWAADPRPEGRQEGPGDRAADGVRDRPRGTDPSRGRGSYEASGRSAPGPRRLRRGARLSLEESRRKEHQGQAPGPRALIAARSHSLVFASVFSGKIARLLLPMC